MNGGELPFVQKKFQICCLNLKSEVFPKFRLLESFQIVYAVETTSESRVSRASQRLVNRLVCSCGALSGLVSLCHLVKAAELRGRTSQPNVGSTPESCLSLSVA